MGLSLLISYTGRRIVSPATRQARPSRAEQSTPRQLTARYVLVYCVLTRALSCAMRVLYSVCVCVVCVCCAVPCACGQRVRVIALARLLRPPSAPPTWVPPGPCLVLSCLVWVGVVGPRAASFLGVVLPWIVTMFCYQGSMLVTICNWSALLTIGVVNLLVPIAVYREVREESKTRRRFCSKRKKGGGSIYQFGYACSLCCVRTCTGNASLAGVPETEPVRERAAPAAARPRGARSAGGCSPWWRWRRRWWRGR
eukprot:COSAG06_NODE_1278_length_10031_cov_105.662002_1_plen_254_part_00